MQRFSFPLERVLKYKERRERLAEMRQMQAVALLQARERVVEGLKEQWANAGAALPGGSQGPLDVAAWIAHVHHVQRLARELAGAESQVRDAVRAVEIAADQRKLRAREAEALRQLRRRREELHMEQMAAAEQRFLDGEGIQRWRQREIDPAQTDRGVP